MTTATRLPPRSAASGDLRDPHTAGGRALRRALGQFATGVAIVSVREGQGRPLGMTINSFASVSLDPPLVLWSVARRSLHAPAFIAAPTFAVSVLADWQQALAARFASFAGERFDGVAYTCGPQRSLLIDGAVAHFVCRTYARHEGGDHVIVVGEIALFAARGGPALVFHDGRYITRGEASTLAAD